jgi:hypothetical protein
MATKATHNLSVITGEYTNAMGETKKRWKTIGKVLQKDDGSKFLVIDRTFNPAGVPNKDDRDSIFVSTFKIDDETPQAPIAPVPAINKFDDDIPF